MSLKSTWGRMSEPAKTFVVVSGVAAVGLLILATVNPKLALSIWMVPGLPPPGPMV